MRWTAGRLFRHHVRTLDEEAGGVPHLLLHPEAHLTDEQWESFEEMVGGHGCTAYRQEVDEEKRSDLKLSGNDKRYFVFITVPPEAREAFVRDESSRLKRERRATARAVTRSVRSRSRLGTAPSAHLAFNRVIGVAPDGPGKR